LHNLVGDWVFGCDVCNRFAHGTALRTQPANPAPRHATLDLRELARMDEETFQARFARSAIRRAKLQGLAQNAAVVAAHQGC
jgi:epoxyqueuosine reductase